MSAKYKVLLLGDGGVGKTSLVMRFTTGRFKRTYKATIGTDIFKKTVKTNEEEKDLQIWDLSGQAHFKNIRSKFYKKANGALLVFDLTNPTTLGNLDNWIDEAESVTGEIPTILVGNKNDLEQLITEDIYADVKVYSKEKGLEFVFTSAKDGSNVEKAFEMLAKTM